MRLEEMALENHKVNTEQTALIKKLLRLLEGEPNGGIGIIAMQKLTAEKVQAGFEWQIGIQRWLDVLTAKWFRKLLTWFAIILFLIIFWAVYGINALKTGLVDLFKIL